MSDFCPGMSYDMVSRVHAPLSQYMVSANFVERKSSAYEFHRFNSKLCSTCSSLLNSTSNTEESIRSLRTCNKFGVGMNMSTRGEVSSCLRGRFTAQ